MSHAPGRITHTRIALLPDGDLAEVALDSTRDVFARWCTGGTWSEWKQVGSGAADVDITAGSVDGTTKAHIVLTPGAPQLGRTVAPRRIYALTSDGVITGTPL
jgi:hypothetical protein